jgi:hypothetical protein
MIKLKVKKEERDNSCSQDINELIESSKDIKGVWKYEDIKNKYFKHKDDVEKKKKKDNLGLSASLIFMMIALLMVCWNPESTVYFLTLFPLVLVGRYMTFFSEKKMIKKIIKGNESKQVDIKDVLKNIFNERYEEEVDKKLLQYVIDKSDKKNINCIDFFELNLEDEYEEIKDKYIELKSKKDELSLLRGIYD